MRSKQDMLTDKRLIYCRDNRDWAAVQRTLDALPGANAKVIMKDGEPVLTANGFVVIEGTEFAEFALKNQGYADVVDLDTWLGDDE